MNNVSESARDVCDVCGKEKDYEELIPIELINSSIIATIKEYNPNYLAQGYICLDDYKYYSKKYIHNILEIEIGKLSDLDTEVVNSIMEQELLSKNVDAEFNKGLSFGDRLADAIAVFGGSWKFIIIFTTIIILWIIVNTFILLKRPFDPYPFILLNLVLSCLASLQAPVIMMSQNRQEAKDRMRAEHDYQINLKAELEIRQQNERIEFLLHEWNKLMKQQDLQLEKLDEILRK